jgi:hypothetical protein
MSESVLAIAVPAITIINASSTAKILVFIFSSFVPCLYCLDHAAYRCF